MRIGGLLPPKLSTSSRADDDKIVSAIKKQQIAPRKVVQSKGTLKDNLDILDVNVKTHLRRFLNRVQAIRKIDEFKEYIDSCIECGVVAIDTETTGIDVMNDEVIGASFYNGKGNSVYVPLRHVSYISGALLLNQISLDEFAQQIARLKSKVKIVMHNSDFDTRIIYHNFGVRLKCDWDTMIAAKVLNNTESAALKEQYALHILHEKSTYDFNKLFKGFTFKQVPIDTATPYAAGDTIDTLELYEYQKQKFKSEPGLWNIFHNIEMPLLEVVADMEDTGIYFDNNYAKELHDKYVVKQQECRNIVYDCIKPYQDKINKYNILHPGVLETPINVASVKQLSILLYDILGLRVPGDEECRKTGEEILLKLNTPLTKAILDLREIEKLLSTYIDKLPKTVNPKTGCIHAKFNTIGADTGRVSSQDPNLQNIPSHNKEVRKLFIARPEHILISGDYS